MGRSVKVLALAAVLATVVAGCGEDDGGGDGGGGGGGDKRIAVVFPTLDAPFTQFVAAGAQDEAPKVGGVTVDVSTSNELTNTEEQIQKIEDALTRSPQGIAVFPSVAEPLVPVLERASSQGVKVLVIDQDIPSLSDKVAFVGTNNVKGGQLAGEYMAEQLPEGGKVGIVAQQKGITSTDQRVEGFKKAIEGSGIEVVGELVSDCDRAKGQTVMQDLLAANPDLAGVFSVCDDAAIGAATAIGNAKKAGDIVHIGFDGSPEAVAIVAKGDGTLDADVAQNPYKMGQESVKALAKAIDGDSVPKVIDTGTEVVTKDNASKFEARQRLIADFEP
jgi:ribose transport system substrate-binding protein